MRRFFRFLERTGKCFKGSSSFLMDWKVFQRESELFDRAESCFKGCQNYLMELEGVSKDLRAS